MRSAYTRLHLANLVAPIKEVQNVSEVTLIGGQRRAIRVLLDPARLSGQDRTFLQRTRCELLVPIAMAPTLDDYERALSLAAARHDLVPILIADPRDDAIPDVGLASFEDLETGEQVLVDTSNSVVRNNYRARMREHRNRQIKLFRKFGLDHCVVRTDRPYVNPLRELFARRAKRARR